MDHELDLVIQLLFQLEATVLSLHFPMVLLYLPME